MGVGGVVGIIIGTIASCDGLDQVAAGVGVDVFLQTRRLNRNQIAVLVIPHGLCRFPQHGDVVKVGNIGIGVVCAGNTNGGDGFCRALGYNGGAEELPRIGKVRIEGHKILVIGIIGIGHRDTQTALLGIVRRVSEVVGVIRDRVCICPGGYHIGLGSRQVQRNILISLRTAILRIAHNF